MMRRGQAAFDRALARALGGGRGLALRRLRLRLAARIAGPETAALDYSGAEISIGVTSPWEHVRRRAYVKEPWTVDWLERSLGPEAVLYDIGANVGSYTLIAARRPVPPARVVAIEPGYASFAALCANVVRNGVADLVVPLPVCLAARTGVRVLDYRELDSGAALHVMRDLGAPSDGFAPAYRQPVLAFSLDDLREGFRLPAPTHLKVDVDGSEPEVLAGAQRTLAQRGVRSLMVEMSDAQADGLIESLAGRGYDLRDRFRRTKDGAAADHSYGLFQRVEAGA
jgi:FkbM family methyltransferase